MRKIMWLAVLLGAACGGADPAPIVKPNLSLLSTVPQPNGTVDRWSDLRFTFNAPVTWSEVQFIRCVSQGCRSPLVPYRFSGTGTEVVGTPVLPPEFGQTYSFFVTPLVTDGSVVNKEFTFNTFPPGTRIASDVTADTVLALTGSPYYFDPAAGAKVRAKLTILPGVEVSGDVVAAGAGSVEAIGLPGSRIRITNSIFSAPARLSYVDMLGVISVAVTGNVDHTSIYGGRRPDAVAPVLRVSGSLTDSRISGVWAQSLTGSVQRNAFLRCDLELGGEVETTQGTSLSKWDASSKFVNNLVTAVAADSYSGVDERVWVQTSGGTISGNSFVNTGVRNVQPLAEASAADMPGNWWGTTDMTEIGSYFAPASYNGVPRSNTPTLTPILTAPDPATPTG